MIGFMDRIVSKVGTLIIVAPDLMGLGDTKIIAARINSKVGIVMIAVHNTRVKIATDLVSGLIIFRTLLATIKTGVTTMRVF